MRIVPINCVTGATTLAKTIYNENENVLLRKGTLLTTSFLNKIKAADINTIYIDDGYSNVEIEDIIKPEIKHAAVKTIKEAFKSIEGDLKQKLALTEPLNKRLKGKVMSKYLEKLKNISDFIIDDILASHNLLVNFIDIKHINDYTYEHSLSVGILSLIVGIELRLNRHDLYCLFIGAILHDLGKVFVGDDILNKGDLITEEEAEVYQEHTAKGYDYIKENRGISATSKIVILQHHENFDGTGYPNGTNGNSIHKFARIVAICDTYDKLTSDSPNSPAVPPNEAIEYIMGAAGRKFDFEIANIFVRKINPYPEGTLVDLSNKKTAVVIDNNSNYPLRPIVQIIFSDNGEVIRGEIIDLLEITDITVEKIRYKDIRQTNLE